jgi:cystathionine beta-lyase/cystathionine gamma-synthase
VRRVLYPGLPSHPGHEIARRQMAAFGGIVTLVLAGGLPAAERFYDRLQLVARAASLGGVESLASLPVHTSHHGLPEEELREAGIDPGMVRLSLGVEDADDLIADVEQALAAG